jgi:hypothetical protein
MAMIMGNMVGHAVKVGGNMDSELAGLAAVIEGARREQGLAGRISSDAVRVADVLSSAGVGVSRSVMDISHVVRRLRSMIGDPRVDQRLIDKVARALVQGRLAESAIFSIEPSLQAARNRGGYFVAVAKSEFRKVGLDWFEENWK